jgi:hypothetical protein
MTRPAKITLAAVIVLIGAGLSLTAGAFALTNPNQNHFISLFVLLFGVWGLATGVGVLRLQRWARLCVFIFVGLTTYLGTSVAPLLMFFQMHLRPDVPELTEGRRTILLLLCLLLIAAGLWCASVLTTRASRELFGVSSAPQPFGVAIIGWYLVMSGIFEIVGLVRTGHSPRMSFGFVFTGWSATAVLLFYTIVHLCLGIGLLRRKEQSRRLTMYYCVFQFFDFAVFYLRPDREAAVKTFYNVRALYSAASATFLPFDALSRFVRLASIEWCIFTLIALWVLAASKNEFPGAVELLQRSAD